MPNWGPYVRQTMDNAARWLTIRMIADACQTNHGAMLSGRTNRPRPSAPCLKNHLTTLIQQRIVAGMKGASGATWFGQVERLRGNSPMRNGPRMPRNYHQRREALAWNAEVLRAVDDDNPIPLPWDDGGTERAPRTPARVLANGPLPEETLSIIRQFCQDNSQFNSNVHGILQRITLPGGNNIGMIIPAELRPHVVMDDVYELLNEMAEKLQEKARGRVGTGPRTLEKEFYDRLAALTEEDDG